MYKRRLKIVVLCLLIIVTIFIAACQPTPDKGIVANKGNGELEDKVKETAQNSASNTTQKGNKVVWEEKKTVNTENEGDYTVSVKMDAQMPKLPDKASVYLIEPKEFSIDSMKKTAEYLMKGEIYDGKESKQDLEMEILAFKKDVSTHTIRQGYESSVNDWLNYLNKRHNNAADSNVDANYKYVKQSDGKNGLFLKSYNDDSIFGFQANQGVGTGIIDNYILYLNDFDRSFRYLNRISGPDIQATGTKLTYEQALTAANKAVTDLFDSPLDMVHSNVIDIVNFQEHLWSKEKDTSQGQSYVFYYTRDYGGIPSLYINDAPVYVTEKTQQYAAPYIREGACVVVDDRGIVEMMYCSNSNTIKTLNENVKLMSFDDILDKFKDGVFYHNLWGSGGTIANINITGIEFGMVREPVKDNTKQYMMVPAWNFTGSIGNFGTGSSGQDVSILALNALDGSIVTDYECMTDPK